MQYSNFARCMANPETNVARCMANPETNIGCDLLLVMSLSNDLVMSLASDLA